MVRPQACLVALSGLYNLAWLCLMPVPLAPKNIHLCARTIFFSDSFNCETLALCTHFIFRMNKLFCFALTEYAMSGHHWSVYRIIVYIYIYIYMLLLSSLKVHFPSIDRMRLQRIISRSRLRRRLAILGLCDIYEVY